MPKANSVGSTKTVASKGRLPQPGPEREEAEEQQEEASGGQSRADLFAGAKPAEGFEFPLGQYMSDLTECTFLIEGEKESVMFKYEVTEGEQEGKGPNAFYNFFDDKGEQQRGIEFFKKDIITLGYDAEEFVDAYREGREAFADRLRVLGDERHAVVIDVKKNAKGYTNVFLKGLQQ